MGNKPASPYRSTPASAFFRLPSKILFIACLLYILVSFSLNLLPGNWDIHSFYLIHKFKMYPPNGDMRWVTALSECGVDLSALAEKRLWGCDPYGRGGGLGYPPMSVAIARFLQVKGSQTELIASAMGLANVIILSLLNLRLVKPTSLKYLTTSILLLSFPLNLGLERGNIDIVIFNLFAAMASLAALRKKSVVPIIAGFSWLVVAIKFYPFAGIVLWSFLDICRSRRMNPLHVALVVGALIGMATALPWFLATGSTTAVKAGIGVFSHSLMADYPHIRILANKLPWNQPAITNWLSNYWGLMVYISFIGIGIKLGLPKVFPAMVNIAHSNFTKIFLLHFIGLTSCAWLATYLLSGSFDYRMILALPAFSCLFGYASNNIKAHCKTAFSIFLLASMALILISPLANTLGLESQASHLADIISDYIALPLIAGLLTAMILPIQPSQRRPEQKLVGPKHAAAKLS